MAFGQRAFAPSLWLAASLLIPCFLQAGSFGAEVRITFLPPPHDGTISLGIYNSSGSRVRTLFSEATAEKFTVGLNGFITSWDGKDDAGQPLPAGKYSARGYSVGRIEVEGIAFHGNEWAVQPDAPKVQQISSISLLADGELLLNAQQPGGSDLRLVADRDGNLRTATETDAARVESTSDGATLLEHLRGKTDLLSAPGLEKPIAASAGRDGAFWFVDKTSRAIEVKEYSATRELKRRLTIAAGEPEPVQIVASTKKDLIFLLERGPRIERVRGLELDASTAPQKESDGNVTISNWKTFLSKTILQSDSFSTIANKLAREKPFVPEEKVRIRLLPNPLFNDAIQDVDVRIAIDREGALLVTTDGLPLRRLTDTPLLKWAVMGREGGKPVTIFQSDGAVVEEFKARHLANMMAFAAGDYQWSP